MKQSLRTMTKSERRTAHRTQSYKPDLFDTSLPKLMPHYIKKPVEPVIDDLMTKKEWTLEDMWNYCEMCENLGIKIN